MFCHHKQDTFSMVMVPSSSWLRKSVYTGLLWLLYPHPYGSHPNGLQSTIFFLFFFFSHEQLDVFWLSHLPLQHPHKSFQNLHHIKLHLHKVRCLPWTAIHDCVVKNGVCGGGEWGSGSELQSRSPTGHKKQQPGLEFAARRQQMPWKERLHLMAYSP